MNEVLNKIQAELKAPKNAYNSFGGYNYRSAESILEAVKPICHKYGATLTLSDDIVEVGGRIYVKATARLQTETQLAEVTAYAREAETKKGMDESQITGTASSYARKYALNGLFCIDDTKDADTDEYRKQTEKASKEYHKEAESASYATLAQKKSIMATADKLGIDINEVLKQAGYKDGKLTEEQYGKAVIILKEISEARDEK